MGRHASGNSADPERLQRVLNAKQRMIGVDVEALNAQVEEKKQLKQAEQAINSQYAEQAAAHAGLMTMSQLGAAAVKKDWDRKVQAFRSTCQGKVTAREWDLNRPDAKRHDLPGRLGDDDARCGPASLQRFDGEDLSIAEREAAQQEQCKAWWDEQTALKAQQAAEQQAAKQQLAEAVRGLDSLQLSVVGQEAAARAELARRVAAANQELRELQAASRNDERKAELRAKLAELAAAQSNPWLNEDPAQAVSAQSPARVRKDHWKGMSPQQRRAIQQEQLAQVEQRRMAAAAKAAEEAAMATALRNIHQAVMQQALSADEFRRKQAVLAADELRRQVEAKAARDAELKHVYENRVDESYFKQFGTSHR